MTTGSLVEMRGGRKGRKERGILIATEKRERGLWACVRWDKPFWVTCSTTDKPYTLEVCWLAASNLEIVSEAKCG